MRKNRYKPYAILLIVICIIISYMILNILKPIDKKYEKVLNENIIDLTNICDYLKSFDCDVRWDIYYTYNMKCYYKNGNSYVSEKKTVEDRNIINSLDHLSQKKFKNILKESNYILFVKNSSLNSSYGLIFSTNGEKPEIDENENGTTEIKNLPYKDWYMYKHHTK